MEIKNKALAYIFRNNKKVRELLVFDHRDFLDVNPQVPGGTVNDGESFEAAVLREIYEESGLQLNKPSFYLGCFEYHREELNQLHKRHVYSFETEGINDRWEYIVSDGDEDKGLAFDYYWLPVEEAREKLVGSMGEYLPTYQFKPLSESDLCIIKSWLQKPHVKEFWDDGESWEELYKKYVLKISSDTVKPFLVFYQDRPIGYIQFYWASKVGDGWWEGSLNDVVGIDQYIGESDFLGKGHGSRMICEFIVYLKRNYKISKITADPSPDNLRAIRCYKKIGFRRVDEINTPDGKVILMEYEI